MLFSKTRYPNFPAEHIKGKREYPRAACNKSSWSNGSHPSCCERCERGLEQRKSFPAAADQTNFEKKKKKESIRIKHKISQGKVLHLIPAKYCLSGINCPYFITGGIFLLRRSSWRQEQQKQRSKPTFLRHVINTFPFIRQFVGRISTAQNSQQLSWLSQSEGAFLWLSRGCVALLFRAEERKYH